MAATSSVAVAGGVEAPAPIALYAAPQTQARLPDGRRYNLICMGEGGPVAVLDVGLRDWSLAWRGLQPELAKVTRTCIADRAGYGFSDPGPLPRDSVAETQDLANALKAAGIRSRRRAHQGPASRATAIGVSHSQNEVRSYDDQDTGDQKTVTPGAPTQSKGGSIRVYKAWLFIRQTEHTDDSLRSLIYPGLRGDRWVPMGADRNPFIFANSLLYSRI
jgi:hypothetical protein